MTRNYQNTYDLWERMIRLKTGADSTFRFLQSIIRCLFPNSTDSSVAQMNRVPELYTTKLRILRLNGRAQRGPKTKTHDDNSGVFRLEAGWESVEIDWVPSPDLLQHHLIPTIWRHQLKLWPIEQICLLAASLIPRWLLNYDASNLAMFIWTIDANRANSLAHKQVSAEDNQLIEYGRWMNGSSSAHRTCNWQAEVNVVGFQNEVHSEFHRSSSIEPKNVGGRFKRAKFIRRKLLKMDQLFCS